MSESRLFAPAKLTRSLRIVGRRDDGYHLIDAEMVSLDLADHLVVSEVEAGESSVSVTGPAGTGVPDGSRNLVIRALDALGRIAEVRLDKRVPSGAGLGGGSSDAAAVLRWAGCTDLGLAAALGADVPFCLAGGRAHVTGMGEIVRPLDFESLTFTLLLVPERVSTPAVYEKWDEMGGPDGGGGNDLEPAALVLEPTLARWRDYFGEATGLTPRLAGSGGTWFVEGAYPDIEVPGARVVVTRTVPADWTGPTAPVHPPSGP